LYELIDVKDNSKRPSLFDHYQNCPNPLNPNSAIKCAIPDADDVSLIVYNILSQTVQTQINGRKDAGNYEIIWNGKDNNRCIVSSGIYIDKLQPGGIFKTNKILLL
jgi:hypothetical protein